MWWTNLPVQENIPLADKTSWRLGGSAQYYFEPENAPALSRILQDAMREGIRCYILGGGSNLLIEDRGVEGVVIRLSPQGPFGKLTRTDSEHLLVGAAVPLPHLLSVAAKEGLAGLEFLSGIPGTVGGALAMNAGGEGRGIGDVVEWVEGMDLRGVIFRKQREEIPFGYRRSGLEEAVITGALLRLIPDRREAIQRRMQEFFERKRQTQPIGERSAGCVFRNPPGCRAGTLIDTAGLKGRRIGHAVVSTKHANFLINEGGSSSREMQELIQLVREEVRRIHGINLELEVIVWPLSKKREP